MLHVLIETLALAHPIIPFVTEEIYAHVPGADGLLAGCVVSAESSPAPQDELAEAALGRAIEAVQALRAWRDSAGIKAATTVSARLGAEGYEETAHHLARLGRVSFVSDGGESVASVVIPGGTVEILPSDGVDLDAAQRRLTSQRAKIEVEIARAQSKLANDGFVRKAPAAVVHAEREKLARLQAELEAL